MTNKETVSSIAQWHQETFPDCGLQDQMDKFDEEAKEYEESNSLIELADMFIVACGIARFDSVIALEYFAEVYKLLKRWKRIATVPVFHMVIDEKMEKNRNRVWEKTTQGNYHHVECNNL
jgi:hypothetical protein